MTELHITRSKDILLYIGEEQLFGVTDLRAVSVYESHPIREFLSGEPYAVVNGKIKYEIRMTVLSLFRASVLEQNGFEMSVVDGDTAYIYEGCTVVRHEQSIAAGKNVVDVFTIEAKGMRKQVQNNAG